MSEKKNDLPARVLPTYEELVSGDLPAKNEQNKLNLLLNCDPSEKWLKKHPLAKNVKYMPIEITEWLLTRLFLKWNVEVRNVQVIANSVVVTVRLHYQDILSNEMLWQDGLGAAPIQTKSGAAATDWNMVLTDAVMKAAPAAETYAVKDAAEKIGKIFGKDMNRADKIAYNDLATIPEEKHGKIFNDEPNTEKQ